MNEGRRKQLRSALEMLTRAESMIDTAYEQEQDCMDNYPENLQNTDKFYSMENVVDCLEEALEKIDEAKERVTTAIS